MKYIITQSQFHSLVYNYLDSMFKKNDIKKFETFNGGDSYNVSFNHNDENVMTFYFFAENESFDDSDDESEESTQIQVHYVLVDRLVKLFGIRKSRVLDIIADWVSEKLNVDVDEIVVYPRKEDF
jgi:hypothetical protein